MKLWDVALLRLLQRESSKVDEMFRYVDDVRQFLAPLCEGWRWTGSTFEFSKSDQHRTMVELNKAMCSLSYQLYTV